MIEQMPSTQGEARRWLIDRIITVSAERRIGTDVATEIVLTETLEHGGDWWKLLGGFCVGLIFDEATMQKPANSRTTAPRAMPSRPAETWREGVDSIWDRMVPIPNEGLKRYGDLTRADLFAISTFYERQASVMRKKAAWFRMAADSMVGETTLEQVVGKLPKEAVSFFENDGGVKDQPELLGLTAAKEPVA